MKLGAMGVAAAAVLCSCSHKAVIEAQNEQQIQAAVERSGVIVELPPGITILHKSLRVPRGVHHLVIHGHAHGSVLRMAAEARDKALIWVDSAADVRLRGFTLEGNRQSLTTNRYLPPSNVTFANFYDDNGILATGVNGLIIRDVQIRHVTGFAILVSAAKNVTVSGVLVEQCGSLDQTGRNNTSGGILLEQGTARFAIVHSTIRHIPGNAIWTHSNYGSPRDTDGEIASNEISDVARDAIQVGHASHVLVLRNRGRRIGYPVSQVDVAATGIPVALDTAGNVDHCRYSDNVFEDVNGQCIDLDGFHDGEVRGNTCTNRQPSSAYPLSHFGIVFGNSNPEVNPVNVVVAKNRIQGFAYGGLFLIGSANKILGNRFLDVNRAACTGDMRRPLCNYAPEQPGMLRSAIYLGNGAARPAQTRDNVIQGNEVSSVNGARWCVEAAPGVRLQDNHIAQNSCKATP
ncbi:MAG TPA: right-handed parallel beta-helix repeat-containing protein [Bryobacteraceae bacterium]|nr:right-handed parallel beta-helix repeat-containing protein [Bryobacteraceae bacterium]